MNEEEEEDEKEEKRARLYRIHRRLIFHDSRYMVSKQ